MNVPTLRQVWHDYVVVRKIRPKQADHGLYVFTLCLEEWLDMEMTAITKKMVCARHLELSRDSADRDGTPSLANNVFKQLRRVFNFAIAEYEDDDEQPIIKMNPVVKLSQKKAWNKERASNRHIPIRKIGKWTESVMALANTTLRDYLIVLLLTGLRKDECAKLKWEYIDFEMGSIHIPAEDTKTNVAHDLPLSRFLTNLLKARHADRKNEYVFPGGRWKAEGYFTSPYKSLKPVIESSGVVFSPHDLRRTFSIIAQDVVGIEDSIRKRLLNHSPTDVTNRCYSIKSIEPLRRPMEQITDVWFGLAFAA